MRNHQPIDSDQPTQRPRSSRFMPLGVLAGLAGVVLLAGGGAAWWTWQSLTSAPTSTTLEEDATTSQTPPTESPTTGANLPEQTVQIYWLRLGETSIEPVATPVTVEGEQPETILTAAFETMLEGSSEPDLTSTIPPGTTLETLDIQEDGVHVNLSEEFTTGGGSASMVGRLAQVVYTATTLDPEAPVWISVEGEPLEVLGGEGILVEQPLTRTRFEEDFPL